MGTKPSKTELPTLTEREAQTLTIESTDLRHLESVDELTVTKHTPRRATIESKRSIGVIGLPSGRSIEIRPKFESNLLQLLSYAGWINDDMATGGTAGYEPGNSFVDLLAGLFISELKHILKRGLHREYQDNQDTEQFIRGRLDLQRQIQSQGTQATRFECEYDELTTDTVLNRLLLQAAVTLQPLLGDEQLQGELHRVTSLFRQQVTLTEVTIAQRSALSLTRLNEYYRDALELAELILEESFIDDLSAGRQQFRSLLKNMENLFETIVFNGVETNLRSTAYDITSANQGYLLTSSDRDIQKLEPDFTVTNQSGDVVLVGDAKWKKFEERPSREDLYQIAAYQSKFEVPGILIYPHEGQFVEPDEQEDESKPYFYTGGPQGPLEIVTVPTAGKSYEEFQSTVETQLQRGLDKFLSDRKQTQIL